MDLNFGSEYKEFANEVKKFCKKYSGVNFSDSAKVPLSADRGTFAESEKLTPLYFLQNFFTSFANSLYSDPKFKSIIINPS